MNANEHIVFISYAAEDRMVADAVFRHLRNRGLDVWMAPHSMTSKGGQEWPVVVVEAIKSCKALVLIFSSHANASKPVVAEVHQAFTNNKYIVPMRIEEVVPTGSLELYTSSPHWVEAFDLPNEEHFEMLAQSLESLLGVVEKIEAKRAQAVVQCQSSSKAELPTAPTAPVASVPERVNPIVTPAPAECPSLDSFDSDALRVVKTALALATRCRAKEISHRLLMAAFVSDAAGFAARACRSSGVEPPLLWALLVAMSYEGVGAAGIDEVPEVKLTKESGSRILFPTMQRAAAIAATPKAITARELFHAFCEAADSAFVQFLRALSEDDTFESLEVDLAEMNAIDPEKPGILDGLTLRARTIVRLAHQFARKRHSFPIPNRLMLAAFLANPNGVAARAMAGGKVPPSALSHALEEASRANTSDDFDLSDAACARIVGPTITRARELAGSAGSVSEKILFRAFCEKAEPGMKAELKKLGVDLDSFCEGKSINAPLSAPTAPQTQLKVPVVPQMPKGSWGLN